MVDYLEALKLPFSDFRKLSIGAGFLFLSSLPALIPASYLAEKLLLALVLAALSLVLYLFPVGYFVECAKTAARKSRKLPEWMNLKELLRRGFFAGLLSLAYIIPFFVILTYFVPDLASETAWSTLSNSSFMGATVVLILLALAFYVLGGALVNYSLTSTLGSGFDFSLILRRVFSSKYLAAWGLSVAVFILSGLLQIILDNFAALGILLWVVAWVISSYVSMFVGIFSMTIIGSAFSEAAKKKSC